MSYLVRVFKTLNHIYWEKILISLKYMAYILLVLFGAYGGYWIIDFLITNFISKL